MDTPETLPDTADDPISEAHTFQIGDDITTDPQEPIPPYDETDYAPMPDPDTVPAPDLEPTPESDPEVTVPELEDPDTETEPAVDPQPGVYGTPSAFTDNWFWQVKDGLCGPSSAAQIISEYTGFIISDPAVLEQRAVELGLFAGGNDPGSGMTMQNLEILMEDQGVPCHIENSSIDDLKTKLEDGYGVIVAIDSGELWYPEEEYVEDNTMDHAVVITGIDEERGVVILSDPGDPNGNSIEYPIDQFENAWADSDYTMLVADETDPDIAGEEPVDPSIAAPKGSHPKWAIISLS